MSTRKGAGNTRTRKPAHQNSFAFRHNPKSQKTAKIINSVNTGLCASCHEKVEWRKKYRKYRPLRQPATCNDCHKKTVTAAYHRLCTPCARERRVCPFCCTKGRPRPATTDGDGDDGDDDDAVADDEANDSEDDEEEADDTEGKGGMAGVKAAVTSGGTYAKDREEKRMEIGDDLDGVDGAGEEALKGEANGKGVLTTGQEDDAMEA